MTGTQIWQERRCGRWRRFGSRADGSLFSVVPFSVGAGAKSAIETNLRLAGVLRGGGILKTRAGGLFLLLLRVEFLLKTESGYPKDAEVTLFTNPENSLRFITPIGQLHNSPPSPVPGNL